MLTTWPDEAARASYLAAFHATQALIFQRTDKIAKTHSGVRTQFALLAKEDPGIDAELRSFLARAYNFKSIAEYETGGAAEVPAEHAANAVEMARRFVDCIAGLVESET